MNPLDLSGPEFLKFYLLFGSVAFAVAYAAKLLLQSTVQDGSPARAGRSYPKETEAYRLAALRGGTKELVRTVLTRLAAENMILVGDAIIMRASKADPATLDLHPIEAMALSVVPVDRSATTGVVSALERVLEPQARQLEDELRREGLLRSTGNRGPFVALLVLVLLAVVGLGLAKLLVALSRGRRNVTYLIFMMIGWGVLALLIFKPPRVTRAGGEFLAWLRESHAGLKSLIEAGRRTGSREMALATAIYGLGALTSVPVLGSLRKSLRSRDDRSTWTSGAGCGSSCSSGGSCGGGGCGGGGCGGCGGG